MKSSPPGLGEAIVLRSGEQPHRSVRVTLRAPPATGRARAVHELLDHPALFDPFLPFFTRGCAPHTMETTSD